jgi:hypothetical protein
LWIFSTITYNCPDGITSKSNSGDDEYYNYYTIDNWSINRDDSDIGTWYDLYVNDSNLTNFACN